MNNNNILWIATETIIFLMFIFVCAALAKSRFTAKKTAVIILAGTLLSTALNVATFLGSHDLAFTLGKLCLTTYLPAIIVLHLLSSSGFCRTIPIWCIGLLGTYAGYFSLKIPFPLHHQTMCLLSLSIVISVICFVTVKYMRKPFHQYVPCSGIGYSLLTTVVLFIFLTIFSYFFNSAARLSILLVMAVFLITAKLFWTEYTRQQLKKTQEEYETLIQAQQNNFEEITIKQEQLREYRHDMRHHLLALGDILCDSDNHQAKEYFSALIQRLEHTENATYCKNQMINAVLSFQMNKAKEIGCELDTHISIPEKTDVEDIDLCIVLSNALENAIHACEKEQKGHRRIKINIAYKNALMISIKNSCSETIAFDKSGLPKTLPRQGHGIGLKSISNTVEKYGGILKCECADGEFKLNIIMFHMVKDAHGPYAMNSHKPHAIHIRRPAFAVLFSLIGICVFAIAFPTAIEAPTIPPTADFLTQVITARFHNSIWGSNEFDVEEPMITLVPPISYVPDSLPENKDTDEVQPNTVTTAEPSAKEPSTLTTDTSADIAPTASAAPTADTVPEPESYATLDIPKIPETTAAAPKLTGSIFPALPEIVPEKPVLTEAVEEINDKMSEYIETLRQTYYWYLNRRYMGYTSLESTYTVLCNDEDMLTIKIEGTLNAGGSANFSRCFMLDKRTGSVVELADLFQEDADYITPISSEILKQMTIQAENGKAVYYIYTPGGMWLEEYCFKRISQDQNFYINDQGKLVIAFDEYEVAPGSMGCVEFVIPTDVIDSILSKPSLIH